jgi:hypothetical protein
MFQTFIRRIVLGLTKLRRSPLPQRKVSKMNKLISITIAAIALGTVSFAQDSAMHHKMMMHHKMLMHKKMMMHHHMMSHHMMTHHHMMSHHMMMHKKMMMHHKMAMHKMDH